MSVQRGGMVETAAATEKFEEMAKIQHLPGQNAAPWKVRESAAQSGLLLGVELDLDELESLRGPWRHCRS